MNHEDGERVYNAKMKLRLSCSGFCCCWIHKVCVNVSTDQIRSFALVDWLMCVFLNANIIKFQASNCIIFLILSIAKNRSKATRFAITHNDVQCKLLIFLYSPVIEENKKKNEWWMLCLMQYFHSNDFDSTNVVLLQLLSILDRQCIPFSIISGVLCGREKHFFFQVFFSLFLFSSYSFVDLWNSVVAVVGSFGLSFILPSLLSTHTNLLLQYSGCFCINSWYVCKSIRYQESRKEKKEKNIYTQSQSQIQKQTAKRIVLVFHEFFYFHILFHFIHCIALRCNALLIRELQLLVTHCLRVAFCIKCYNNKKIWRKRNHAWQSTHLNASTL